MLSKKTVYDRLVTKVNTIDTKKNWIFLDLDTKENWISHQSTV